MIMHLSLSTIILQTVFVFSYELTRQADRRRFYTFTHIISSFRYEKSIIKTYESMLAAKDYAELSDIRVQLISVQFPEDSEIVPENFLKLDFCLHRSTSSVYGPSFKKLPFLNDILKCGMHYGRGQLTVFSNNDIALQKEFYVSVLRLFRTQKLTAATITRETLPESLMKLSLSAAYKHHGQAHPGKDCFVWDAKLNGKIGMGDLFIGYAPWG